MKSSILLGDAFFGSKLYTAGFGWRDFFLLSLYCMMLEERRHAFETFNAIVDYVIGSFCRLPRESLDIAIYSLTHPDLVKAIQEAKKRGVAVRVISDKSSNEGKSQVEALKILGSAGIPLKQNTHSGLMHLKLTIADKKVATTGSYNYSKAVSTTNDEVFMVIRNEGVAESFSEQFERMWNDTT